VRGVQGVAWPEPADERDFPLWLCPGDEWRREDAKGEGHDGPNSVELHDDLLAGQDAPTSLSFLHLQCCRGSRAFLRNIDRQQPHLDRLRIIA
jgi:hypothetical protein